MNKTTRLLWATMMIMMKIEMELTFRFGSRMQISQVPKQKTNKMIHRSDLFINAGDICAFHPVAFALSYILIMRLSHVTD